MKKVAIIGLCGDSLFYNLDHLPKKGETVHASFLHREVGGKGFNQAVALKRQGIDVYFLGAVGNDDIGKKCEDYLKNEGINAFLVKKDVPSACASILKAEDGNNEVVVYRGASDLINLDDLKGFYKYIDLCDWVMLTYEIPHEVLKETVKYAKEKHKKIFINPAPYVYDDMELLKAADLVCPNKTEAKQMFKVKRFDFDDIYELRKEYGLNDLVITLGKEGSVAYRKNILSGQDLVRVSRVKKIDAVDSTGAGDVFCACLCAKLTEGEDLFKAVKYANQEAGKSVLIPYVLDAIPRRKDNE
ncbi:MAG: ribokinase [Bacilli bacterium]|nr:ribokinase [Bacilli bacterium]